MTQIDYFLFPISPFTYLAGDRLEGIAAARQAEINYKPFDLMKVFAEVGTAPVGQRHPSKQAYRLQELARIAAKAGMNINVQPKHFPTNPAPASAAIIVAQAAGGGDVGGLVRAILRACWAEERDVAQDAVLGECLEANGFEKGLLMSGLLSGMEQYERNTQEALERGVFGSPTYLVGDQVFWGQDRLEYLDDYLSGS